MAQLLQFFWIFLEFVFHFANGLREVPGRGLWRRGNQRFSGEKAMRQRKIPVWEANEHQLTLGGRIVQAFQVGGALSGGDPRSVSARGLAGINSVGPAGAM